MKKIVQTKTLLSTIRIRGFEPHTYGTGKNKDNPKRKKEIRDILKNEIKKIESLDDVQKRCKGKKIFMRVRFYLWKDIEITERPNKDLDNLLKLLLDAICDHIDGTKTIPGLGIMVNDREVFQIHADKKLVDREADEGFEIEISEYL